MVDCDRWLNGDVSSVHVVIAKNWRITVAIRIQNVTQRCVTVLILTTTEHGWGTPHNAF
jgi:hypothetical protein